MRIKHIPLRRLFALLLCLGLLSGCEDIQSSPGPAQEDGSWKDVLQTIPYYGDVENCAMTADQALAYAQLLADGIAGKVYEGSFHDTVVDADADASIFWIFKTYEEKKSE